MVLYIQYYIFRGEVENTPTYYCEVLMNCMYRCMLLHKLEY